MASFLKSVGGEEHKLTLEEAKLAEKVCRIIQEEADKEKEIFGY
jgi:hypothetical protein